MSSSDNRQIILDVLREHPEGLTIVSLAELSGMHRHTATKYIYELLGAGAVLQRTVGAAKLCYMCNTIKDQSDEKKLVEGLEIRRNATISQVKMVSAVALLVFLMSGTAILAYQNTTILNESANSSDLAINSTILDAIVEANALLEEANLTEIPSVENALSVTLDNSTEKNQTDLNLTVEVSNETVETESELNTSEANMTQLMENVTEVVNETQETVEEAHKETAEYLVLSLEYPEKTIRGDEITVKAFVYNADTVIADSVSVVWSIPEGFSVTSGSLQEFLGSISAGETKTSTLTLKTDVSTVPGTAKIKAVVNYE